MVPQPTSRGKPLARLKYAPEPVSRLTMLGAYIDHSVDSVDLGR